MYNTSVFADDNFSLTSLPTYTMSPQRRGVRHFEVNNMETLKCSSCQQLLNKSLFNRDRSTKRGFDYRCRPCAWLQKREWRKLNPEKNKASHAKWRSKYQKEYRKKPEVKVKTFAVNKVNHAIRDGRLFREPCEVCGAEKVEAHHEDYSKPLDVMWLCKKHHTELHNNLKKESK